MLQIVLNEHTRKRNLYDTASGALLYKDWPLTVRTVRIHAGPGLGARTFFTVVMPDGEKYTKRDLLDENGKAILAGKRGLSVWKDGSDNGKPVLILSDDGETGYLADMEGNGLTDRFEDIEPYRPLARFHKVYRDGKVNFLEKDTYRLVSETWFADERCSWQDHQGEEDYVADVKVKGRWRVLRTDGSIGPIRR